MHQRRFNQVREEVLQEWRLTPARLKLYYISSGSAIHANQGVSMDVPEHCCEKCVLLLECDKEAICRDLLESIDGGRERQARSRLHE